MKVLAIIYFILIIILLWTEKIVFKSSFEVQYKWNERMRKLNRRILDNDFDIVNENRRLIDENYDLREKNRELEEKFNRSKNIEAKVISEEKTNE